MKIGTRTLVTNTYSNDRNRYLTKSAYGNEDYVTYGYDSHGRVTTVGYEDQANAIQYEFDSDGRLGLVRDNISNRTRKLLYDLSGRSVGYDETGTNWSINVRYGYDDLNNVSVKTEKRNGVTYTSSYSYDSDSRVTGIGNANSHTNVANTSAENSYDPLGQLTSITSKKNNEDILVTEIEYDRGLVKKWKNTTGGSTDTYEYTYDDRGNITKIKTGGKSTTYVYDTFDQLLRENNQAAGKTWEYTYDHGGNITSKTDYASTTQDDPGNALSTKTFTYGNSTWKDLLTKVGSTNIDTDEIGNLTEDNEWEYTWQHGRQLAGMSKTGTTVSFSYDADGLRTAKTVTDTDGTTTTSYVYEGGQLTDMVKGSDDLHFTYDSVGPATVIWNNHTYFYLRNAQGDICGLTDKDGTRVVSYSYDAWGNLLGVTGSKAATLGVLNPLRYRGYVFDVETGLYYLQCRYYDPEICRFISADGYASTGQGLLGSNMFAYCLNNPINYIDETGEIAGVDDLVFVLVLAASIIFVSVTTASLNNDSDGINSLFSALRKAKDLFVTKCQVTWTAVKSWLSPAETEQQKPKTSQDDEDSKRSTERTAKRKHYSSRKKAKEAAKKAGKGKEPIEHYHDQYGPHFHPDVPEAHSKTPKEPCYHDHYYYPK